MISAYPLATSDPGRERSDGERSVTTVEDVINKDFAVGYSGGLDSTLIALILGRRYSQGRAHLITVQHGHGHLFPCLPKIHVRDLKKALGEQRVIHRYAYTKREFRQMVLNHLISEYHHYGNSNFVVCLGCYLSMDVHLIAYCLEHMVPTVTYGYTPRGSEFAVMSLAETCRERRKIYDSFGLLYRIPLVEWHMEKPEERVLMRNNGIWPGLNFRKIAMGVQPPCLLGITMHHMDILFEIHPQPDRTQVVAFIRDHAELVRELVIKRLASHGIYDVEERIAQLRALNASENAKYGLDAPILDDMEERRLTARLANLPSIALKSYPNTVPLYDHPTLSRDGRPLRVPPATLVDASGKHVSPDKAPDVSCAAPLRTESGLEIGASDKLM